MSISLASMYSNVSYALNLHSKKITELQEQSASGNRVNQASDDPSDAYQILRLNSAERSLEDYQETISDLIGDLEVSSTVLDEMYNQISTIETALTQIVGGIYDDGSRKSIAEQVNSALEQLVSLANTEHRGQYLFSGDNTEVKPYAVTYQNGYITSVTYQGSSDMRSINVSSGVSVGAYYVGDDVFSCDDRQDPTFLGSTGAASGTGTSTVEGNVWLTVEQDGTGYRLSVDDGATWVTSPAGGDTNLAVTDSRTGKVLYVDTTGITSAGTSLVQVSGTYNVFDTLISLRDMLLNERGLSTEDLLEYMDQSLAGIEDLETLLVQAETTLGSQIDFLDTLSSNQNDMAYDVENQTNTAQEADVAQIAIDLTLEETLYETSLAVASKLLSLSLWDFIS